MHNNYENVKPSFEKKHNFFSQRPLYIIIIIIIIISIFIIIIIIIISTFIAH